jgi:hypothetical protein
VNSENDMDLTSGTTQHNTRCETHFLLQSKQDSHES